MASITNSPGTMADDATVGTVAWTNPDNAKVSDTSYATVAPGNNGNSHYLVANNFGFSIPTGATINGISAEIQRKKDANISDNSIKIVKGGTISGDEKSAGASWNTTEGYVSFGGSTDAWGLSWTPSDINSSGFGVAVSAHGVPTPAGTASINHIRITVYYTPVVSPFPSFIQGSGGACFIAGTPISTPFDDRAIELIQVGDTVFAFDSATNEVLPKKVTNAFAHEPQTYLNLTLSNGKTVGVTPNHPIFNLKTSSFERADTFKVGDELLGTDGLPLVLECIMSNPLEMKPVYNIEVEDLHTYFASGIGVHNKPS